MRNFLFLLLSLALTAPAWAEPPKPAARVAAIQGEKNLFVRRANQEKWFRGYVEMDNYKGERLKTDSASMATLLFLTGGQANLDKGTEIEIVSDRKAEVVGNSILVKSGAIWAKVDKQKEELQVQTSGGVMGIKGTEFVVEVLPDGATRFSLLEGRVEVRPILGEAYSAEPGSQVTFGPERRPEIVLRRTEELLEQLRGQLGDQFFELRSELRRARESLREARTQVKHGMAAADEGVREARRGVAEARAALRAAGLAGYEEQEPGLSVELSGDRPVFHWEMVEAAPAYAVMVTSADSFRERVDWAIRTSATSIAYPADAAPLSGTYRWRVLPLDADGRPRGTAYEGVFHSNPRD